MKTQQTNYNAQHQDARRGFPYATTVDNPYLPVTNRPLFSEVYAEAISTNPAQRNNAPLSFEDYVIAISG